MPSPSPLKVTWALQDKKEKKPTPATLEEAT